MSGEGRESRCAGNRTGNMVRLGAFPRVCVNSERLLKRCRALSLDPPSPRQSCCSHADAAHRSTWCQALIGQDRSCRARKKRKEKREAVPSHGESDSVSLFSISFFSGGSASAASLEPCLHSLPLQPLVASVMTGLCWQSGAEQDSMQPDQSRAAQQE